MTFMFDLGQCEELRREALRKGEEVVEIIISEKSASPENCEKERDTLAPAHSGS